MTFGTIVSKYHRGCRWRWRQNFFVFSVFIFISTAPVFVIRSEKVPVPDDCSSSPFENGLSLQCSLSAINSDNEKTNFSVIPSELTLALTVRCREPAVGQLEPDGFRSLFHLKSLTIDGCNLKGIPNRAFWGLEKLESLTIRTQQAGGLVIDQAAFFGLSNLLNLDLSGNHVEAFSWELLCPTPHLQSLNLSHNEIGWLSDSSKHCVTSLIKIDLSYNELSVLSLSQLPSLESMSEIWLGHNYIRKIEPDVARMSKARLTSIDLTNNQLSSLPKDVFAGAKHLERISLANNTIQRLPDVLFESQQRRLQVLDLSGNILKSFSENLLKNQTGIVSLDLSFNELEVIKTDAFSDLKSLQLLKLDHNRLNRLSANAFSSMSQLQTLVLSGNALETLPTKLFSNLSSLTHLLLDSNQLSDLPNGMFDHSGDRITVLDLSHNKLAAFSSFVEPLVQLQSLSLSQNLFSDLGKLELPLLWRLQASGNRLQTIGSSHLKGLPALQVLDLSSNSIGSMERDSFKFNLRLQAVRLDDNKIEKLDNVFANLPHLSWLNISANEISDFDYAMVPKTLRWLDLHQVKPFVVRLTLSILYSIIL